MKTKLKHKIKNAIMKIYEANKKDSVHKQHNDVTFNVLICGIGKYMYLLRFMLYINRHASD